MADIIVDGFTKVWWVGTIANKAAPTVAELNAGMALEDTMTADGLQGFAADTADVDNTSFSSTFNTVLPGRNSFSGTQLVLKKQDGTDTIFNTLKVRNVAGHVVIRDGMDHNTAWAAAQKVQVFPVRTGLYSYEDRAANTVLRYRAPVKISAEPNQDATVA